MSHRPRLPAYGEAHPGVEESCDVCDPPVLPPLPAPERAVYFEAWTDADGCFQLSISEIDEKGLGSGYRILGPKFTGSSRRIHKVRVDPRMARSIRTYLDKIEEGAA